MWLPFRGRAKRNDAGSRRQRQLQRALDEEFSNQAREANSERVDQANASASVVRAGGRIFGFVGPGWRPSVRQQLKEEGYDGD